MTYVGADVESLRSAAAQMRSVADELDGHSQALTSMLGGIEWVGDVATRFLSSWTGGHRINLTATSHFFREAAETLERNAGEQQRASSMSGAVGGSGLARPPSTSRPLLLGAITGPDHWSETAGAWADAGGAIRMVADDSSLYGAFFSSLDSAKDVPLAGVAGTTISAFGYFSSAWTVREHVGSGNYGTAAAEGAYLAGDVVADQAKAKGGPKGYLVGVTVQTWTEVAREARHVDWSAEGWDAVASASMDDWAGAFGEAAQQMPSRLVKIFGL